MQSGLFAAIYSKLKGGGSTTINYQESYITSDAGITGGNRYAITSLSLPAGTWLVLARVKFETLSTITAWNADIWIGTSSASDTGALAGAAAMMATGEALSSTYQAAAELFKIVTLASPATIYLNCISDVALTVKANTSLDLLPNATGIEAIQLA